MSWRVLGNLWDPAGYQGPGELVIRGGRIESMIPRTGPTPSRAPGPGTPTPNVASVNCWELPPDFWILPGFVDSHTHLLSVGLAPLRPDLSGGHGVEEALEILRAWLEGNPGDAPVIGEGWDQSLWRDPAPPTRAQLDRIAPARPVAIRRVCGHIAVLNSAALRLLGDWPQVDSESGLAVEDLPLKLHRLWPPTEEQFDQGLDRAQERALSLGVTGITEMGHANTFRTFGRAASQGRLHLRVTHFFGVDLLEEIERTGLAAGFGGNFLRAGGIKIFLDGSFGGRSAAVRRPYAGEGAGDGMLLWEDARLRDVLIRSAGIGFPVAMHAIGERAITQAISTVEALRREGHALPPPGARVEHAEELTEDLVERGTAAGMLFSMQPNFTARWQHRGDLYESVLGWERAERLNPYRRVASTGQLLFGSDCMPLDPWLGLRGAMTHPLESERLSLREALLAYSGSSAAGVRFPFGQGRLSAGEPADLLIAEWPALSRVVGLSSSVAPGAEALEDVRVLGVLVDGILRSHDGSLRPPGWLP